MRISAHPKQLRRLKSAAKQGQAPREYWIDCTYHAYSSKQDYSLYGDNGTDYIHVTELPPGSAVVRRESLEKCFMDVWCSYRPEHGSPWEYFTKLLNLPSPEGKAAVKQSKGGKG
jgi:hypothetical protein